jgi:hypothetical protein
VVSESLLREPPVLPKSFEIDADPAPNVHSENGRRCAPLIYRLSS